VFTIRSSWPPSRYWSGFRWCSRGMGSL
jgi:hypothetical protein